MKRTTLTERQTKILDSIRSHVRKYGVPPTRAELAKEHKISNQAGVDRYLSALAKKGWVRLLPGKDRGIQLLREGAPVLELEDLSEITAEPADTFLNSLDLERLHDLDAFSEPFESRPDFFLRVRGNSMDLVGLLPGDFVAFRRGGRPKERDIVVVRLGRDAYLGAFSRKENGTSELTPVSSRSSFVLMQDLPDDRFEIAAIVVGAIVGPIRKYQRRKETGDANA